MKPLYVLSIVTLMALGCSDTQKPKERKLNVTPAKQKTAKAFKPVADFPTVKDSAQFIAELRQTFNLGVYTLAFHEKIDKITAYKKVRIYGSDKDFILIAYHWGIGALVDYPWVYQLLLTTDGKLVKTLSAQRYEFLTIFPDEPPFLLTVKATARGNGGHELFKVSADTLENVYDGYFDYAIKTYDEHEDSWVYEPNELRLKIKDFNNDGFNDISFNGKMVFIEGQTKEGKWYDTIIKNGKKITYSIDHPFRKVLVGFVFLYDKQTGHFKAKENYKEKYGL